MKIKETPRFTETDFLTTTKPYEFISESAETLLEEQQLVEIFRREALHFGVMNFAKMYFCYKQDCSLSKDEQQKDIKEIMLVTSQEEADRLLSTGKWKVILKLDKPIIYSLGRIAEETK